jgi:hypothetical protein
MSTHYLSSEVLTQPGENPEIWRGSFWKRGRVPVSIVCQAYKIPGGIIFRIWIAFQPAAEASVVQLPLNGVVSLVTSGGSLIVGINDVQISGFPIFDRSNFDQFTFAQAVILANFHSSTQMELPSVLAYIFAFNNNGPAVSFSQDRIASAFIGGNLTTTQADNLPTRLNAYITAWV